MKIKKYALKFTNIKKIYNVASYQKGIYNRPPPPKMEILIQNTILEFPKAKIITKKTSKLQQQQNCNIYNNI